METIKDVSIKLLLFVAAMPLVIGLVAGGYALTVVMGAALCVAIIFKVMYSILFK